MPVLTPEGIEFASAVFTEMDADGSGTVSKTELAGAAKTFAAKMGEDAPSDEQIEARIAALEFEEITLENFLVFCAMIKLTMISDAVFMEASGGAETIGKDQLKAVMSKVRENFELPAPSDDEVSDAMSALDQDGSGDIDFAEFTAFFIPLLLSILMEE